MMIRYDDGVSGRLLERRPSDVVVERLKARIESVLDPLLRPDLPFALLDFPNHDNIGDSAIWLGTLAYFRAKTSRAPAYVCTYDYSNLDELERRCPEGPIFLQGGGNFGDIWPWYQTFRQAVLARFPGRKIVQLPQTVYFENAERLAHAADVIARHGNFVLLVRDQRSFDVASTAFDCDVELCPDMAFYLGSLDPIARRRFDLLLLMRADRESTNRETTSTIRDGDTVLRSDWPVESRLFRPGMKVRSIVDALRERKTWYDATEMREHFYALLARERVRRGLDLVSTGTYMITDRLHAHILAVLLGVPHHVMDNSYGKVAAFVAAWTSDIIEIEGSPGRAASG